MPIELLVFGLWIAALFLVVWQAVLTVQLQRLRNQEKASEAQDLNLVGVGMLYNGLIEELRTTADEKIMLLEQRIYELEALLEETDGKVAQFPSSQSTFARSRLRRCG